MFGFWFFESGMNFSDISARLAASVVVVILFLPLHEIAHLWANGALSGNKFNFKSIALSELFDPFGAVCMVLFGYGWAKSVYFPNAAQSRKDRILISLAGPFFNFLSAVVAGLTLNTLILIGTIFFLNLSWIFKFLYNILSMNVTLTVFNLIPVPPLDGFRILEAMIPGKYLSKYYKNYILVSIILALLLLFGFFSFPMHVLETAVYKIILLISNLPFIFVKRL
jgi:Zn-dependent protease